MQREKLFKIGLFLGDVVITQVALFLALFLRNKELTSQFSHFSYQFFWVYVGWILIIFILNLYDIYFFEKPLDFFFNVLIFSVAAFFASITYFYFIPIAIVAPKTILLLNVLIFSLLFFVWRYLANLILKRCFPQLFKPLHQSAGSDAYEEVNKRVSLMHLSDAWFLENIPAKESRIETFLKRFFDVVVALLGLLLFFALFPIIAIIITLDSKGGILYHQKRVGKDGNVFSISKFRTMKERHTKDQELWREKKVDEITTVGRVLRRLHLDELPQSWSMLKGDISFVGPRPEWVELARIFEKEIPFYTRRYLVKPGIIGWAQINFPASQSLDEVKEKFQYDLYYIKNHSLLLDLEIILKAIKLFFW